MLHFYPKPALPLHSFKPNLPYSIKRILLLLALFCPLVTLWGQESTPFGLGLNQLMAGKMDSLSLDKNGEILAVQFDEMGWEYFNLREQKELQNFRRPLTRFRPLVKADIVEIRSDFVALLLYEKNGNKVHLASFALDGTPVESFLLHDHYGYLYEKNFRAYSYTKPVHYNEKQNTFDFYQLIYGYEPIPSIEEPTQDPVYHQSFHQVTVNFKGQIELIYSEKTGKKIFNRAHEIPVIHEVAFHELSVFTVSDASDPEMTLWSETFLTHGDMDSHDSLMIYLPYAAQWENRFFFIKPGPNQEILDVCQRHENVPIFPGDGSTCDLQHWKRYQSNWQDLHYEEYFFSSEPIEPSEKQRFPTYSAEELRTAFEEGCGSFNETDKMQSVVAEPHPDNVRIVVDRIVFRIRFKGPNGAGSKYLVLHLANSC